MTGLREALASRLRTHRLRRSITLSERRLRDHEASCRLCKRYPRECLEAWRLRQDLVEQLDRLIALGSTRNPG